MSESLWGYPIVYVEEDILMANKKQMPEVSRPQQADLVEKSVNLLEEARRSVRALRKYECEQHANDLEGHISKVSDALGPFLTNGFNCVCKEADKL